MWLIACRIIPSETFTNLFCHMPSLYLEWLMLFKLTRLNNVALLMNCECELGLNMYALSILTSLQSTRMYSANLQQCWFIKLLNRRLNRIFLFLRRVAYISFRKSAQEKMRHSSSILEIVVYYYFMSQLFFLSWRTFALKKKLSRNQILDKIN